MQHHRPLDWLLLLALVVMWGSAFLFNAIAVQTIPPMIVVTLRLIIGAIMLWGILYFIQHHWQKLSVKLTLWFIAMAIIGNALPFYLITWGQQYISSGLAGILMAIMPLTTLLLAHFFLPNEKLTKRRGLGFTIGFIGIIILMGPSSLSEISNKNNFFLAELAVLAGAVCYALGTIIARLKPESSDIMTSALVLSFASLLSFPISLTSGFQWIQQLSTVTAISILFLGVIATGLATIVYFRLLRTAGATFVSLINYLIPIWALIAGVIFLDEAVTARSITALIIILAGIAIAQARWRYQY